MPRWYLIQTKPSSESIAQTNLERQGYEIYFPRLAKRVRRRGHWCEQIVALFPRYLFLHLHEGHQPLAPARSTTGVTSVVRFGCSHAIVPDRVICDLRARADEYTGLHRLSSSTAFTSGMTVRVTMGALNGLEGIFEREAGAERVVLLLNLLGHETRVRVPVDFVEPLREVA